MINDLKMTCSQSYRFFPIFLTINFFVKNIERSFLINIKINIVELLKKKKKILYNNCILNKYFRYLYPNNKFPIHELKLYLLI